ncbi:glycoside hydrolase family 2 TIM barrel-domain containing protein [Flavivirga abyssicola]|uniref:glycoside hydrolase family 2 protein n=1 Tax=Flavivirga abyssicola TaxID=3063533 RepID=UPI0026DEF703|nr:glycoside hydrolase family 2 TIM barrel-domain containing protein [Flavivirga sp. MEBiC07777]WVK13782.1 glycoside hydrolase family 2 TIM barrel-domain containing protein [Flavivirga sp. MEBiC07777]
MKGLGIVIVSLLLVSCINKNSTRKLDSDTLPLNGIWHFLASNDIDEQELFSYNISKWDTIAVPGNWDTRKRYSKYVGKGYYQKEFEIPRNWNGNQILLKFEGVYQTSKVWLNGTLLGEHFGGYLPFEFNITDQVDYQKTNKVIVMADNTYQRGAWWPWGGISRDVTLKAEKDVRLIYQHITAVPDFDTNKVNFNIKYKVQNNSNKQVHVTLKPEIENVLIDSTLFKIEGKTTTIANVSFERKRSDYKLWHFDTPNLYKISSKLKVNGEAYKTTSDKFGIRKFEVRGEQFYLNNKPVRMNGINRVHDHPIYGNTEPDHLIKKDMLDIKSLGCNFSRLMHAPLSKNILKFCDSIGFLLVEEIPVWGADDPQSFPNNPVTKKWLKDMVERDFNHPSVVAWSVGNELRDPELAWKDKELTKAQYGYVNSMLDYLKELDTTRLKTYVTITAYRKGEIGKEPYEKVDFISMNTYGKAVELATLTHEKFPGKPIFISEIGRKQIGAASDARLNDEMVAYIEKLKDLPFITGVSLWSYNDYRSKYKGTPKSGYREWGIVDKDRNKKAAYYQLKEVYEKWNK